jgi:hypothetical protein
MDFLNPLTQGRIVGVKSHNEGWLELGLARQDRACLVRIDWLGSQEIQSIHSKTSLKVVVHKFNRIPSIFKLLL